MNDVVARTGKDLVVAAASVNPIVSTDCVRITEESQIISQNPVVAIAAEDEVVTAASGHQIVSTQSTNDVIAFSSDDHVKPICPDEDILAVGTENDVATLKHRVSEIYAQTSRQMSVPQRSWSRR
jgi:hypothetical protein